MYTWYDSVHSNTLRESTIELHTAQPVLTVFDALVAVIRDAVKEKNMACAHKETPVAIADDAPMSPGRLVD